MGQNSEKKGTKRQKGQRHETKGLAIYRQKGQIICSFNKHN